MQPKRPPPPLLPLLSTVFLFLHHLQPRNFLEVFYKFCEFILNSFHDSMTPLCHGGHLAWSESCRWAREARTHTGGRSKVPHVKFDRLPEEAWLYKEKELPTSSPNLPPGQTHFSVTSNQRLLESLSFSTMENYLAMVWQAQMVPPAASLFSSCWL